MGDEYEQLGPPREAPPPALGLPGAAPPPPPPGLPPPQPPQQPEAQQPGVTKSSSAIKIKKYLKKNQAKQG
ncbi:unnamed protein product [Angiostrongylus costaricensis]|uniref:WH2 domain-containing protein n=1 Tax=Angiostrongylus costaricensis TaxID=334426 RepID=A0A0R3PRB1_ANGCS|nr:unnamed protein product [Angiostrongylus costaricensis]